MSNKLEIKYLPIDSIVKYVNNTRTHSREQIDQIKASVKEFGMCTPIGIHNDVIVYGHARHQAMQELGEELIPTVDLSHLTEAQKKAYIIADNQLALNADWNFDLLKLEISTLEDLDFDVDLLGFDNDFLESLLEEPELLNEGLIEDDHVPEPPEEPITKLGDVWLLGNHRLMCGDSTSVDAVEKLMDGKKADMVFTDPPYGLSYQSNRRVKSERFDVIENDETFLDIAPIVEMFSDGWVFVWTSWKVITKWINMFKGFGYPTNQVIWHKPGGGIGDLKKTFSSDYETALVWNRGAELCGKRIGSVWKIGKDSGNNYNHPTQKPVALVEEAINKTTKNKNLVMDIFGGSGSTLIACEKTNRKCYMMELSEKYCDVTINRWQEFTGSDAILEGSGESFNELKGG